MPTPTTDELAELAELFRIPANDLIEPFDDKSYDDDEPTYDDYEQKDNEPYDYDKVIYITPDDIFSSQNAETSFIYAPINGLLTDQGYTTHGEIISSYIRHYRDKLRQNTPLANYDEYNTKYNEMLDINRMYNSYRKYIFGRIGQASNNLATKVIKRNRLPDDEKTHIKKLVDEKAHIISFWNRDEGDYEDYYSQCMKELYNKGLIKEPTYVSTPINGITPASTPPTTKSGRTPLTPEEYKLQKDLHQLPGPEKKRAMQKLGLGFKGEKEGWQKTMRDTGIIGPGQKWWAPHSESTFARKLNTILEIKTYASQQPAK